MKVPSPPPRHVREPAPEALAFRFRHGPAARSLAELASVLREAPEDAVAFHRGHLAAWLRDVVGDEPLARRVEAYAADAPAPDVFREIVLSLVEARLAPAPG